PSALLAQHPTLMKRPVIEVDKALHLGWTAEVRAALGLG
ncbi:MAG: ArsC/Spx/MgsR family protein, partial [Pseudomonadota bacterium]